MIGVAYTASQNPNQSSLSLFSNAATFAAVPFVPFAMSVLSIAPIVPVALSGIHRVPVSFNVFMGVFYVVDLNDAVSMVPPLGIEPRFSP